MTSKEALEDIIETLKWVCSDGKTLTDYDKREVDIIKKDLERLEKLEKAIEIIKKMPVTFICKTLQEYELIKEVLCGLEVKIKKD